MKDNMKWLLVLGVIGIFIFLMASGQINLPGLPSLPSLPGGSIPTIQVSGRDASGNVKFFSVIGSTPLYAVVESQPNITVIDFSLRAKNTGQLPLTVTKAPTPVSTPSVFDTILNSVITPQTLSSGQTYVWSTQKVCSTSADCLAGELCNPCVGTGCAAPNLCGVSANQFVSGTQPTVFSVNLQGSFTCPVNNNVPCQATSGPVNPGQTGIITAAGSKGLNIYSDSVQQAALTADVQAGFGTSNCLTSGTTCSLDSSCCSAVCQSKSTDTSTATPCSSWSVSSGTLSCLTTTNQVGVGGTLTFSFSCPSTASRCDIYKPSSGVYNSTTGTCPTAITPPTLLLTCAPGTTCSYRSTDGGPYCLSGDSVSSTVTKSCA